MLIRSTDHLTWIYLGRQQIVTENNLSFDLKPKWIQGEELLVYKSYTMLTILIPKFEVLSLNDTL